MNAHTVIDTFGTIGTVNLSITLCLNIAWATVCMLECYRFVNRYINCKRTPDLHPIYKDVQYLSRQRRLYNLKTHIVKYYYLCWCWSSRVNLYIYLDILKRKSPQLLCAWTLHGQQCVCWNVIDLLTGI